MFEAPKPVFIPNPKVTRLDVAPGAFCVVVDDLLADPQAWREWAIKQAFAPAFDYPYPGLVLGAPLLLQQHLQDYFGLHVRKLLHCRRTLDAQSRFSVITTPPNELQPVQWLCHRDRVTEDESNLMYAASVLYLFDNPKLGGTSFYKPLLDAVRTDQLIADSQMLSRPAFSQRYALEAGYMNGTNAYFEQIASIPAKWNRAIFYDGGIFHSADVGQAQRLRSDVSLGRLTLNSFYTCRRNAR